MFVMSRGTCVRGVCFWAPFCSDLLLADLIPALNYLKCYGFVIGLTVCNANLLETLAIPGLLHFRMLSRKSDADVD